jgi:hypothetical protein
MTDPAPGSPSDAHAHPPCKHGRTQVIAKDDDTQYIECLDCSEIFEIGELPEGAGFDGSLSDA